MTSAKHPERKSTTETSSKSDPVFAAINRHRLARENQNKIGPKHANTKTHTKDGKKTPEFRAIEQKFDAAVNACGKQMRELIEKRPTTIECPAGAGSICTGDRVF